MLQRVQERMHALGTYQVDEVLGPPDLRFHTTYQYQAPDRMRVLSDDGGETVVVGTTIVTRSDASQPWTERNAGAPLPVPSYMWDTHGDAQQYVGMHILGTATVDGIEDQVLAFAEIGAQEPAWFKLWADPDGLVRRAEMRADGHVMDDTYTGFDAPVSIDLPPN